MFRTIIAKRQFSCITYRSKMFLPTKKDTSLGKLDLPRYTRLLLKGGYIHQTEPGMFTYLPLGQHIIDEMSNIIDRHMNDSGAQKMQMPILQNTNRWDVSGRRDSIGKELYTLKDRKGMEYCLSPTNEEVITDISKDLAIPSNYPFILYQTSQKFRDEKRIKSGVLRSKEFLMTDAYSFDKNGEDADSTFDKMSNCFMDIYKELEIPVEKLQADNGMMGGRRSQEFHCICGIGEDKIVTCKNCGYKSLLTNSTSYAKSLPYFDSDAFQKLQLDLDVLTTKSDFKALINSSSDVTKLISIYYISEGDFHRQIIIPRGRDVNIDVINRRYKLHLTEDAAKLCDSVDDDNDLLVDFSLAELFPFFISNVYHVDIDHFTYPQSGDGCRQCDTREADGLRKPSIQVDMSLELGHMFSLGDRYSKHINLQINEANVMMGCYGLGVSRMFGSLFQLYGYNNGIILPDSISTYDVALINASNTEEARQCTVELLDALGDTGSIRILFDDRDNLSIGSRLHDAELAGARVAVLVGNQFAKNGNIDLRLLHKPLIQDIMNNVVSDEVGPVHNALKHKIESFDFERLSQLGYKLNNPIVMSGEKNTMGNDGFTISSGFSTLYWNLIQTLSCIKTYSSKV